MTDAELAAIEARAATMLASAAATERDEPDLAEVAGKIRGHARELAVLVAALRSERAERLRAEAAHAAERVAWGERKVELLERCVALEASLRGAAPAAEWHDEPPTLAEVVTHSAATDAATGSAWGVWVAEPVNTLGACPRVVLLRAMHDGGGVWAHVDGERAVALPEALARLGAVRWMRWLFGPVKWPS